MDPTVPFRNDLRFAGMDENSPLSRQHFNTYEILKINSETKIPLGQN